MIKINLKNTKASTQMLSPDTLGEDSQFKDETFFSVISTRLQDIDWNRVDAKMISKIAINCFLIITPLIGLKVHEIQTNNKLKDQISALNQTLSTKQQKAALLAKKIQESIIYKEQATEFDNKKKIFKTIAKKRLNVPNYLDQIQLALPSSVWLKRVALHVKKNDIEIEGESTSQDNITKFINNLGQIINTQTAQFNTTDLESKVKFTLKAKLGLSQEII